jgi:hypothetical protein
MDTNTERHKVLTKQQILFNLIILTIDAAKSGPYKHITQLPTAPAIDFRKSQEWLVGLACGDGLGLLVPGVLKGRVLEIWYSDDYGRILI